MIRKEFITLTAESVDNYILRFEDHHGRQHIVVPAVILVEGVHNGSAGPLYYPPEELAKTPAIWNGSPVTINHPETDSGMASANDPIVMRDWVVGTLFNAIYDSNIRGIRVELWIDVGRCQRISPETLNRVRNRQAIEISTGLWFDLVSPPGTWNGEDFIGTVINMVPDHLAILPDARGACSITDGCGIRANEKCNKSGTSSPCCKTGEGGDGAMDKVFQANVRSTARRPSFTGTESTAWSSPSWGDIVRGYNRAKGTDISLDVDVAEAPQTLKRWAARLSLLGDENADDARNLVFFPVVNPANENLNERALRAVLGGRGSQANIPESARESAQTMARQLLNSEFDAGLEVQSGSEEEDMKTTLDKEGVVKTVLAAVGDAIKNLGTGGGPGGKEEPGIPEGVIVLNLVSHISKEEIAKALALMGNQQVGMREIHEALQTLADGFDAVTPTSAKFNFVEEIFMDNTFVMRVITHLESGPSTMEFFKGSFEVDGEGIPISINDEMVRVRERREFVELKEEEPVPDSDGEGEDETHNTDTQEEDDLMDKKEIVNQIIACGRNGFGEDDRDSLLAMEEEVLTKMVSQAANQGDPPGNEPPAGEGEDSEGTETGNEGEGSDNGGEPGDDSDDGEGEGDADASGNEGQEGEEGDGDEGSEEETDAVAFLEGKEAPPAMIEATRESMRVLKEEKDGIIKTIMEHGANTYSEEALRNKDIFDLRSISCLMEGSGEEEEEVPGDPKKVVYLGTTGNTAHKKVANSDRATKPLGRPGINRTKKS